MVGAYDRQGRRRPLGTKLDSGPQNDLPVSIETGLEPRLQHARRICAKGALRAPFALVNSAIGWGKGGEVLLDEAATGGFSHEATQL